MASGSGPATSRGESKGPSDCTGNQLEPAAAGARNRLCLWVDKRLFVVERHVKMHLLANLEFRMGDGVVW